MTNVKIKDYVESLYIDQLGITSPSEIDIEAIAFYKGAMVVERCLNGCEAMIIGAEDSAVISINPHGPNERKRFSIGHELGHWINDRGSIGNLCSKFDIDELRGLSKGRESIANEFASELLLPTYLLKNHVKGSPLNLDLLSSVKDTFKTSFMASLRRVISSQLHMGFFAIFRSDGTRRLFHANKMLPYSFLPPENVPKGSKAYDVIFNARSEGPGFIDGDVWCKDNWAQESEVFEHTFHYHDGEFITLVWWKDEEPIWLCREKMI